jgi:HlyD family secretion protein
VNVQFVETYPFVKPGMTAEVDITTAEHFDVLKVPIQAVVIRDELPDEKKPKREEEKSSGAIAAEADSEIDADMQEWLEEEHEYQGVYVIRDGKAKFVQVTTGIADRQDIEITSGLQGGEEIVIGPYKMLRRLKHDDLVKIDRRDENNKPEDEE